MNIPALKLPSHSMFLNLINDALDFPVLFFFDVLHVPVLYLFLFYCFHFQTFAYGACTESGHSYQRECQRLIDPLNCHDFASCSKVKSLDDFHCPIYSCRGSAETTEPAIEPSTTQRAPLDNIVYVPQVITCETRRCNLVTLFEEEECLKQNFAASCDICLGSIHMLCNRNRGER